MTNTPPVEPEPPGALAFVMMLVPTLFFDVALPIIAFNVLRHYGVSILLSLVAGGLAPGINNVRVWMTSRRIEPLGLIVIAFLAIGTTASLISGSVFFTLIKDSFLTGTFGFICLVSLFASRPLLFVINRQFVAGDDPARIAWWNGLWQYERFRNAMRFVTGVWGVAYIVEAFVRVGFALVFSPATVVMLSPVLGFGVLIALIFWTRTYMYALRDKRVREQQAAGAG